MEWICCHETISLFFFFLNMRRQNSSSASVFTYKCDVIVNFLNGDWIIPRGGIFLSSVIGWKKYQNKLSIFSS